MVLAIFHESFIQHMSKLLFLFNILYMISEQFYQHQRVNQSFFVPVSMRSFENNEVFFPN